MPLMDLVRFGIGLVALIVFFLIWGQHSLMDCGRTLTALQIPRS